MGTSKPTVALSLLALSLLLAGGRAEAIDGAGIRSFDVESDPAGAEVITITGHHGTTPLTLDERDIYPNSYASEDMAQYGVVTLRKAGCRELNIRPGDSDIVTGLSLQLECGEQVSPDSEGRDDRAGGLAADAAAPPPSRESGSGPGGDETPASRKLEQLRFLQELLEEGLITPEEEAIIRRRILERP
ncbi:hypothetical protein [Wenzhouxiangella sediminis]|jgi:hypothetical protein|uniref:hypothetical protein n=1 Tax=Wenzhouxiangella sediminis TaxID=1792836 RepID=UPI001C6EFA1B|nr:hypothetical protein [Wenzhouxiangella sediminis]